jgi:hypothetical protein
VGSSDLAGIRNSNHQQKFKDAGRKQAEKTPLFITNKKINYIKKYPGMSVLKNYINGAWVDSSSTETRDVLNPATNEVLAKVPYGAATALDVINAAAAAQKAYV